MPQATANCWCFRWLIASRHSHAASVDFRFAAAVASFGMILRDSPYKGTATMDSVLSMAEDGIGSDKFGYRREFLQLVQRARQIR